MQLRSLNRYQAFAWHFLFSAILGLAVFLLFRFVWYPGALWTLSGAGKLLLLVVGIDVTLGPLLTLIVFNPKKRSLPFDLAIIAFVQMAALAYGVWVMAQSRPVFLVGVVDRFVLVAANEIDPNDLAEASDAKFARLSWAGPQVIGAEAKGTGQERMELTLGTLSGGADIDRLPKFYVDYEKVSRLLISTSETLTQLEKRNPKHLPTIKRWTLRFEKDGRDVGLLLLRGRQGFATAAIDRNSGEFLGTYPLDIHD